MIIISMIPEYVGVKNVEEGLQEFGKTMWRRRTPSYLDAHNLATYFCVNLKPGLKRHRWPKPAEAEGVTDDAY